MASHADKDPELHGHGDTHGHGTRDSYIIGFLLAAVLTAIPFWLVMTDALRNTAVTALLITAMAVLQIIVHVRFFLHVEARGEGGWTLVSFIFTAILVVITIGGSVWAMYQMSTNMMPMDAMNTMQMP